MRIRLSPPAIFTVSLQPALALAAEGAAPDIGGGLLQLLFGFALLLGLLFATMWLLKKVSVPRGASGGMVRVVSAAAVGPRERVVLVDVGGKRLVLGVAPGHVGLLDTQAIPAQAAAELAAETPVFAHWLKQTLAKRNAK